MQVDLYLRWLLYVELFTLFIVFIPVLSNVKRSILLSLAPLFSKTRYTFWIFTSYIGFIFVTTAQEVYTSNNASSTAALDATAKLELARNERDALLSFITLLLLPVIYFHSNSVVRIYKLEQSLTAMTKQATNVSTQYSAMLAEQSAAEKKAKQKKKQAKDSGNSKEEKNEKEDEQSPEELRNELDLYKARFQKEEKKCKDLQSELEQTKEQLANYEMMQKAVKKKV